MIKINGKAIDYIIDPIVWSGTKNSVARLLTFSVLYNPLNPELPRYQMQCGDRAVYSVFGKMLFAGEIQFLSYETKEQKLTVKCADYMLNLKKIPAYGRFRGTLDNIANNICGIFGLVNGINSAQTFVHNIVSTGNMTYYDVLNSACAALFNRYKLYLDGMELKLCDSVPCANFIIGQNIHGSTYSQSIMSSVNNIAVPTPAQNKAIIVGDNNNQCLAGRYVNVFEPLNNLMRPFEILSDVHTVGVENKVELSLSV